MNDRYIRLLENTAIRYVTAMDYRTVRELISCGCLGEGEYFDLKDIKRIYKDQKVTLLSDRSRMIISEVIKAEDKVKKALDRYIDITQKENIRIIEREHEDYPFSWKCLSGMPPVFFAKGDTSILSDITRKGAASIVGSRKPGRYSLYATSEFSKALSEKGVAIVSGMAVGIDRMAHVNCMDIGGRTVAVIAGGADVIYPSQNRDIYDRICSEGVLITELPPGQEVLKQYFPSRNRLISALSDVCLIMEAGLYSGTLHTASFAASQGKDVFVLPNSIYAENSIGGLMLIRDGAEVLIDVDTVYDRIENEINNRRLLINDGSASDDERDIQSLRRLAKDDPEKLNEDEWKSVVCDEISEKPRNIDELCISLGIPFTYLSSIVTMLETEGRIANDMGRYVLTMKGY
ncbi:MAG: DNA-processing protein DprA [Clostridiales bacterium]|nr:DNA-processing protein DprA [Clostridiales bacterium]